MDEGSLWIFIFPAEGRPAGFSTSKGRRVVGGRFSWRRIKGARLAAGSLFHALGRQLRA
jgi:hypothetical protein